MLRRCLWSFIGLLLVSLTTEVGADNPDRYPVMRPDPEIWRQWQEEIAKLPQAKILPQISENLSFAKALSYGTSMDLLDEIDYVTAQRNQGSCGNCWVWAGTGVMEIAHNVQDGVFERLSIQHYNSCDTTHGYTCCGGNLGRFATWYNDQGFAIPWANTNAAFADGARRCSDGASNQSCAGISETPAFPIDSVAAVNIDTHSGAATAIANIKNILNQDKGIYFGFALPDNAAWNDFFDFWDGVGGETEATLWPDHDAYCGDEWEENGGAGGHAIVILGYDDDDADPANHYWLALNSWGTAGGNRPDGLIRIPMSMDYNCSYPDNGTPGFWAFYFGTLDIEFGNAPPISDAGGPYAVDCAGVTTTVALDGTGSSDPEGTALGYAWTSNCPGASFDDASAPQPVLTVNTAPGCAIACSATLTVTDAEGASASNSAIVSIVDNLPPVLTCPADVTIECDASTAPSDTGLASALDACSSSSLVFADAVSPGTCPQASLIARTWTATDACGNESACLQQITVEDTTAPVLSSTPPDMTVECDAVPEPPLVTASDNCDTDVPVLYDEQRIDGACPASYTLVRTWSATDDCGNSVTHTQTITVQDTTPPVIQCNAPATIVPPDAPITFGSTATDNCSVPSVDVIGYDCVSKKGRSKLESCVVTMNGADLSILDSGGVGDTVSWTVLSTDGCGNSATAACAVEVVNPGKGH